MNEQPLFILNDGEKLFSIIHYPEIDQPLGCYIFCHPFAEEKLWSHRVYVSFARKLVERGYLVVRFDMRGYGDSEGDFADISSKNHLDDIKTITDYVLNKFKEFDSVRLLGLRMGGALAALAAAEDSRVSQLVLWEPIINGERYMQEILRSNLAAQMAEKGKVEVTREDLINDMKSGKPINVEGYSILFDLFDDFSGFKLIELEYKTPVKCLINQVVRNVKQPVSKDFVKFEENLNDGEIKKSEELQFWKEIKEFYFDAGNLFASTLEWIDKHEN